MPLRFKQFFSLLIVIFLLSVQHISAQTPAERYGQIRSAVEAGDLKKALSALGDLREANPQIFVANNFDYLEARLADLSADSARATSRYQSVLARKSLLSQYALWHLAQKARSIGDLVLERERLRQLVALAPPGLLRESANLRLGESFFESADYPGAISALERVNDSKNIASTRQASVLIGQSYLREGRLAEARNVFERLVAQMPDASRPDDFALAAVRALDSLGGRELDASSRKAPTLTEAQYLLRASIYQFNRDFDGARVHYQALLRDYPNSQSLMQAQYQIARGMYQQQHFDEAFQYLEKLVFKETGDPTTMRDATALMAAILSRQKETERAVYLYKWLSEHFPNAPNPERPYLNIIDALHEAGRYNEALDWVRKTREKFKDQIGAALALFAQLRIHLAQGSWQAVVSESDELLKMPDLGGTRVAGGTTKSELTFLRSAALEQLGKIDEAISGYLSLPEGRNDYYGARASQRLLALSADTQARGLIVTRFNTLRAEARKASDAGQAEQARSFAQTALRLTDNPGSINELRQLLLKAYSELPAYNLPSFKVVLLGRREILATTPDSTKLEPSHQALADELLFLGLYDEAVPEFTAARTVSGTGSQVEKAAEISKLPTARASGLTDIDYTMALYSLRGGFANRAVRFAEQVWKNVPNDYLLELAPRELVELLYPIPYRESLLKHGGPRNVDARFLLSIARQESRFQADAKSVAAARGMMQFIPATANEIALQLGRNSSNHDDLYNPDTAILFGSQYLSNLFKQFPGQPQAVAASYNGGPENTARWIARSRSNDADRYLPEIGFSQTKDYVYKVLSNFWIYEQLYDAQLQRKPLP